MFYVLNFKNHQFVTAHSLKDCVCEVVRLAKQEGANPDFIEIVCAFQEDVRLTVNELLNEAVGENEKKY